MRRLWLEERIFVQNLKDSIETLKDIIPKFERYVQNHEKLKLDQEPSVDYLGHPINAYNLIKHSALGWSMFDIDVIPKLSDILPKLNYVLNRPNNTAVPDINEIHGASFGIARLHTLYNLDTENFVQNGIVDSNFGHVHVKSEPSAKKLSSYDLSVIGDVAYKLKLFTTALPTMEYAMKLITDEKSGKIQDSDMVDIFTEKFPNYQEIEKYYNTSVNWHDQHLLRKGSRYGKLRLFTKPKGNSITSKEAKLIAKREKKNKSNIVRVDNVEDPYGLKTPDHYEREQHMFRTDFQKELLCSGQTFRVSKIWSPGGVFRL